MISRLGLLISRVFRKTAPDPFVLAVLLTLLTAALALAFGDVVAAPGGSRLLALFDLWRGNGGLWKLLDFAMQMCLVLVSGHALASSPPAAPETMPSSEGCVIPCCSTYQGGAAG